MTKPLTVDKLLYTPVEAAHALGLSRSTIYVLMASGEVPSVHIGSSRRIPADGLRRYVATLYRLRAPAAASRSTRFAYAQVEVQAGRGQHVDEGVDAEEVDLAPGEI